MDAPFHNTLSTPQAPWTDLAAVLRVGAVCVGLVLPGWSAASNCGTLESHYGPYDYRVDHDKRPIVESYHFGPRVEALAGGMTSTTPGGDLDYVLQTFPNHARALVAVMRWSRMKGTRHPADLKYSVDCYFDRALRFRADDVVVRMLFAQWLKQTDRRAEALQQLAAVDPEGNAQTAYNLGLLYAELGEYALALRRAHEAQAAGFDIGPLQSQLEQVGHWRPALPEAASAPAAKAVVLIQ